MSFHESYRIVNNVKVGYCCSKLEPNGLLRWLDEHGNYYNREQNSDLQGYFDLCDELGISRPLYSVDTYNYMYQGVKKWLNPDGSYMIRENGGPNYIERYGHMSWLDANGKFMVLPDDKPNFVGGDGDQHWYDPDGKPTTRSSGDANYIDQHGKSWLNASGQYCSVRAQSDFNRIDAQGNKAWLEPGATFMIFPDNRPNFIKADGTALTLKGHYCRDGWIDENGKYILF